MSGKIELPPDAPLDDEPKFDLRQLADMYESTIRVRTAAENRVRAMQQGADEGPLIATTPLVELYSKAEDMLCGEMEEAFEHHPCYRHLMGLPGINKITSCRILGMIGDPTKFARFSNLRTFCGLTPGKNRPVKGEKLPYCRRLKVSLYIAYSSMLKTNATLAERNRPKMMYADIYYKWREIYAHRHGTGANSKKKNGVDSKGNKYTSPDEVATEWSDLRQSYAAKNKLLDVFVYHLYEEWLERLDLPVPGLYVHDVLGHHMKYNREDFWSEPLFKSKT